MASVGVMTTPTGQISMGDVRTEIGATGQITMNDADVRTLSGVASGAISMSDLQGKTFITADRNFTFISGQLGTSGVTGHGFNTGGVTSPTPFGTVIDDDVTIATGSARMISIMDFYYEPPYNTYLYTRIEFAGGRLAGKSTIRVTLNGRTHNATWQSAGYYQTAGSTSVFGLRGRNGVTFTGSVAD